MKASWIPPASDRISNLINYFFGERDPNTGNESSTANDACKDLTQRQQSSSFHSDLTPEKKDQQALNWTYSPLLSKGEEWMQIIIEILQTWSNICLFGGAVRDLICGDTPHDLDFQVFELPVFWDILEWMQKKWPAVEVKHSLDTNYPWLHARILMSPIPIDIVYKSTPTLLDIDANGCQLWCPDKSKTMFQLTIPSLQGVTQNQDLSQLVFLRSFLSKRRHWPITERTQCQSKCIPLLQQIQLKKATVLKVDKCVKMRMICLIKRQWKLEYKKQPISIGNGTCCLCGKEDDVMMGLTCFSCI